MERKLPDHPYGKLPLSEGLCTGSHHGTAGHLVHYSGQEHPGTRIPNHQKPERKERTAAYEFANFDPNLYKPFREYYRQGVTLKHTYLWGYNHTLPVAVIDGLDYSETLSLTGQTDLNSQLAGYRRLFRFPRRLLECDARCQHGDGKDNLHGGLHG